MATHASAPADKTSPAVEGERPVLDTARVHSPLRNRIARYHRDTIDEVQRTIERHPVVVVGMRQNPYPKRARKALHAAGVGHEYLEYGSYFSDWHRRLALKLWSGWPTLPMVFVNGMLVGGADDLKRLVDSGELKRLLG
ncbi:MAG: glutaredoxin domain-containing protein [Rubrivivax sp.]